MNRKMSKRQRDIKSKLMAAICMLLVSSIMMVSTTYAWFTLSTAPEVTGITTAVGANGNLEIALMPVDGEFVTIAKDYGITTGTGDSMAKQAANLANVTWGNLVDLREYYGLENIVLQPAALTGDEQEDGTITYTEVKDMPLSFPKYGSDGRISELSAATSTGVYAVKEEGQSAQFWEKVEVTREGVENTIEAPRGVRAVGSVSGMTPREGDRREALQDADSKASTAIKTAKDLLESKGSKLAEIAVKYAKDKEAAKFTTGDVQTLIDIAEGLDAALTDIEEAYKAYIYAYVVATDPAYAEKQTTILGSDFATLQGTYGSSDIAGMFTFIDKLKGSQDNVDAAMSGLNALLEDTDGITWGEIVGPMNYIANKDAMLLNGDKISGDLNIMGLLGGEIVLTLDTGSGIFADIADHCGEYSKQVKIDISSFNMQGFSGEMPVTMKAQPGTGTRYLQQSKNLANVEITGDGDGGSDEELPISDYYGYIIDLAFRTNADTSYLKLQTDGVDRIYNEGTTNESTQGAGSTWTFTSKADDFTPEEMIDLMKSLRVVFFNPDKENEIIGYGVMDQTPEAESTVVGKLKLARSPKPNDEGVYDLIDDNKLIDLTKNQIHRVSALVYLDGTTVTNADVAANGTLSMLGALNLQFASSAELTPMEYSDLQDAGNGFKQINSFSFADGDTGYTAEVVHHSSGTIGAIISKGNTAVTNENATVTISATVTSGDEENQTTETVSMEAEYKLVNNSYGWAATGFGSDVTKISNLVINIEFTGVEEPEEGGEGNGDDNGDDDQNEPVAEPVGVTFDGGETGVTQTAGEATATKGSAYSFTLSGFDLSANTYTVTYQVGSEQAVTLSAPTDASMAYEIPAADFSGDIVITVTAEPVDPAG